MPCVASGYTTGVSGGATTSRVVARADIVDVLTEFCHRIDEYDVDGVAELFTEDCVTDYGPGRGGEVRGRDATRRRLAGGQGEFRRTAHHLSPPLVRFVADGVADTTSYVLAWHERWDGRQERLSLRYLDRLVLEPDGAWRIAVRQVEAMVADGFEGVEWRWVNRRPTS